MKKKTKREAGLLGYERAKGYLALTRQLQRKESLERFTARGEVGCIECGKKLTYEKRRNNYCSRTCAATANNRAREHVRRTCRICGAVLLTHKGLKYCSKACMKQAKVIRFSNLSLCDAKTDTMRRRVLLRDRGNCCQECGITEWRGRPAPIEVDHIDGNSSNNLEENLRLLCCNCHAQTPTYRAKNKGNGRGWRRKNAKC